MTGKKGMTGSGGFRKNAKRPLKYGEPTERITVQIPKSKVKEFKQIVTDFLKQFIVKK